MSSPSFFRRRWLHAHAFLDLAEKNYLQRIARSGIALLVAGITLAILLTFRTPSTLFGLSSATESVDVDIVSPSNARIYLPVAFDEITERCVKDVSLIPVSSAQAKYSRLRDGPLYILLSGSWRVEGGAPANVDSGYLSYRINGDDDGCDTVDAIRLPANGLLTIGSENIASPDNETLVAHSATIDIYARSVDRLFGLIPLDFGPFRANALYHVTRFSLPALSRISDAVGFDGEDAAWWGLVDVRFDQDGLDVAVSANAQSLNVYSPAPRLVRARSFPGVGDSNYIPATGEDGSADTIALSFGARLLDDPNLQWLYVVLLVLVTVSRFSLALTRKEEK